MIGTINLLIAFLNDGNSNLGVLCSVLSLVITASMITEPVFQLYLCEISNNSSLGFGNFVSYGLNSLLGIALPSIVGGVGPSLLFYVFGGLTIAAAVFEIFVIKETAFLTDKEKKDLYTP